MEMLLQKAVCGGEKMVESYFPSPNIHAETSSYINGLYYFARVSITKYHGLNDLNQRKVFFFHCFGC